MKNNMGQLNTMRNNMNQHNYLPSSNQTHGEEYSIDLSKNNASSIRKIAREEAKVKGGNTPATMIRDQSQMRDISQDNNSRN